MGRGKGILKINIFFLDGNSQGPAKSSWGGFFLKFGLYFFKLAGGHKTSFSQTKKNGWSCYFGVFGKSPSYGGK